MSNQKDSLFNNILVNIVIPVIVLSKFSKEEYLGPVYGLVTALLIPLVYGLYEFFKNKRKNYFAVIGFVGILFSGVIGLLKFPPHWIAIKEAAVPFLIGVIILVTTKTKWQFVKKIIYNKNLLNTDKIEAALYAADLHPKLDQLLFRSNILLGATFFVSATLNYILAKVIVKSVPGTTQFNEELGRMAMLSLPVIAIPLTAIMALLFFYIVTQLKKLTRLSQEELFIQK